MSKITEGHFSTLENIQDLALKYFGLTVSVKKLPGEFDLNFYVQTDDRQEYILKIAAADEKRENLDFQNQIMLHLAEADHGLQLPQVIANQTGQIITELELAGGQKRWMRLLTWVPGKLWVKKNPKRKVLRESLGAASAQMCRALQGFDHPAAHRFLKWDNAQALWIKKDLHFIQQAEDRALVEYFLQIFEQQVWPYRKQLRQSVIHNDANDYNTLVDPDPQKHKVLGFIDFGDAIFTHTINDLAIAAAYALMNEEDPLAALGPIVRGFHQIFPLTEKEMEVLFPLIAIRLCISLTVSARNAVEEPENEYLLVSARPAWDLLQKFKDLPLSLAHFHIRQACALPPCPSQDKFKEWLAQSSSSLFPIVKTTDQKIRLLNLGVASLDLGNNDRFNTVEKFKTTIATLLAQQKATIGYGGYAEIRPFYTTDAYQVMGNEGPQWRTLHLGLDVWAPADTPIFAPLDGRIHSFQNNAQERDYGPTIILEHRPTEDLCFYTLYGHLSNRSLAGLTVGQSIEQGQKIATLGEAPENGNWPPHLHFQVILDMLGKSGDFPGVAFPEEAAVWKSICPAPYFFFPPYTSDTSPPADQLPDLDSLLTSRREKLGKGMSVSYQKPLHMVRGFGVYLYDRSGRRYLDTTNNVPHVGHQHPRVVAAGQKQMGILNTNTRYLHENILHFAEELTATLPPELSVCHFVNSGSEANELALRMAKNYTGQKDLVVLEVGYHGNTGACIDISSYKFDGKGGRGAPPHVQVVPMPNTYRGAHRGADAGQQYAQYVRAAIAQVQAEGRGIAGFIGESILSCGGQVVLPQGYLKEVYQEVRAAGGLCIADEVQTGLGRVGDRFWAFELQGVVPDIVSIGKPIGNGHPLAAVVCTRAVADAFNNGMEYFNTFGGNPVSCAIGREVIKIVQEEGLQEQAKKMGDYLQQGLRELAEQHPIIGDVRGHGLFLGFELVKNRRTLEPAAAATTYLSNRMRELGILTGTDGPLHNVIKIKPPMCFEQKHADFFLATLGRGLEEISDW